MCSTEKARTSTTWRRILNENRSEGLWRRFPHTQRNGNLYPTHGLGPHEERVPGLPAADLQFPDFTRGRWQEKRQNMA